MKRLILITSLLLALLMPVKSWAAMAFDEVVEGASVGLTTTTVLSALTPLTGGNHIVGAVKWETTTIAAISSVTDTAGNTYSLLTKKSNSGTLGAPMVQGFYCLNATGNAANIITVTLTNSADFKNARAIEFTGTSVSFDVEASGEAQSGTTAATAAFSTANAAEYVFSMIGGFQSETYSSPLVGGNAGTLRGTCSANDSCAFDRVTSSAISSGTAGATLSASNRWTIVTAAFKEAGGAATPRNLMLMGVGQ